MSRQYEIVRTGVIHVVMIKDRTENVIIGVYNMQDDVVSFVSGDEHRLKPIKDLIREHYKGMFLEVNPEVLEFENE